MELPNERDRAASLPVVAHCYERWQYEGNVGSDHRGLRRRLVSLHPCRTADDRRAAGAERSHRRGDLGPSMAARIGEPRRSIRWSPANTPTSCENSWPRTCSGTSTSSNSPAPPSMPSRSPTGRIGPISKLASGSASLSGTLSSKKVETSRTAARSRTSRAIWASSCPTSPIAPACWRTGTKERGEVSSARRISSAVTPMCSALHSTSRRTLFRGCRSPKTPRACPSSWIAAWPSPDSHESRSTVPTVQTMITWMGEPGIARSSVCARQPVRPGVPRRRRPSRPGRPAGRDRG